MSGKVVLQRREMTVTKVVAGGHSLRKELQFVVFLRLEPLIPVSREEKDFAVGNPVRRPSILGRVFFGHDGTGKKKHVMPNPNLRNYVQLKTLERA